MDVKFIALFSIKLILQVCLIVFFILLPVSLCARESEQLFPPIEQGVVTTIYVVNHGKHAGIILKRSDFQKTVLPRHKNFSNAEYLEIGWGDKDYYQAPDPHIGLLLKAGILPTSSVLHIVAFNSNPVEFFPGREIVTIDLTRLGIEKLGLYIANSFAINEKDHIRVLGTGLYGNSYFYLSRENYHLFNTCNVWIAGALQAAGIPIVPFISISTDSLMRQLSEQGDLVQHE